MGECLRESEHGYLGLVGQGQFGKDRHFLSPSLLFASTVAPTIEKSIGTRHEEVRRSAFMCLVLEGNLPFVLECFLIAASPTRARILCLTGVMVLSGVGTAWRAVIMAVNLTVLGPSNRVRPLGKA